MIDDHKTVHAMVWVIMDGLVTVMSGAWPPIVHAFGVGPHHC